MWVCVCVCMYRCIYMCLKKNDTLLNSVLRLSGGLMGKWGDGVWPSWTFHLFCKLVLSFPFKTLIHLNTEATMHQYIHTHAHTRTTCFCASFQSCYGSVLMSITLNSIHCEARRERWEKEMKKGKTSVEYKWTDTHKAKPLFPPPPSPYLPPFSLALSLAPISVSHITPLHTCVHPLWLSSMSLYSSAEEEERHHLLVITACWNDGLIEGKEDAGCLWMHVEDLEIQATAAAAASCTFHPRSCRDHRE